MELNPSHSNAVASSVRPGDQVLPESSPSGPTPPHADPLERIRRRVSLEVGSQRFERYFDRQARLSVRGDDLDVTVPSPFMADLMSRRFGAVLQAAIREEWPDATNTRTAEQRVHFRVEAAPSVNPTDLGQAPARKATPIRAATRPEAVSKPAPAGSAGRPTPGLPSRHRLEHFIVGHSNRLAYAAAVRVAESDEPGDLRRLFIQGSCGVGKTHLLHAVAQRFSERRATAIVRCLSAEEFTNEYITAVRANKIDAFRKKYRRVDLLCLDDVHFLSNKDKTQHEIQHTLDTLDLDGGRLVLASDEHPRDIHSLSEHLVSRFLAGAVVRIDPPDLDVRERVVRAIASRRGIAVDGAAVGLLASPKSGAVSVRELEGIMTQVEAYLKLSPELAPSGVVGGALARRVLGVDAGPEAGRADPFRARPVSFPVIVSEVCRELGVDHGAFTGKGRHPRVVLARCLCGHLGRQLTTLSFPEIARHMGRPTHSTIISACRRLQARLDDEAARQADLGNEFGAELAGTTLPALIDRVKRGISSASSR